MDHRSQRLNELKQAASMMVVNEVPNETVISSIAEKNDIKEDLDENAEEKVDEGSKKENTSTEEADIKMVGLGDSLTKGSGDSTGKGYIGRLSTNIEQDTGSSVSVQNYAVHGRRTPKLYKILFEDDVEKSVSEADVILMSIGGNDLMKVVKEHFLDLQMADFQREQSDYVDRLDKIMKRIRSLNSDAPIIFIGLYNPLLESFQSITEIDQIVQRWNGINQSTVEKDENTTFVPVYELFNSVDENLFFEDQFHPNDDGYELMARQIQYHLNQDDIIDDIQVE